MDPRLDQCGYKEHLGFDPPNASLIVYSDSINPHLADFFHAHIPILSQIWGYFFGCCFDYGWKVS